MSMSADNELTDRILAEMLNDDDDFKKQEGIGHVREKYQEAIYDAVSSRFPELDAWELDGAVNGVFDRILQFARAHPIELVDDSLNPFLVTVAWGRGMDAWRSHVRKRQLLKDYIDRCWMIKRDAIQSPVLDNEMESLIELVRGALATRSVPRDIRVVHEAIADLVLLSKGWKIRGVETPSTQAIVNYLEKRGEHVSRVRITSIRKFLGDLTREVLSNERWFLYCQKQMEKGPRKKD